MKKRYFLLPLLLLSLTSCIKDTAKVSKVELSGNISDALTRNNPLSSTGENNILYVPLNLDDSFNDTNLNNLKYALTGSTSETGYYSVKEYFNISSYNKLTLNIDLTSSITSNNNIDYYIEKKDLDETLIDYLNTLDLAKYDNNNDNIVDYVCFVYKTNKITDYSFEQRFNNNFTLDLETKINDTYRLSNVSFVDYATIISKYESYYDTKSIVSDSHDLVHQLGYALGLLDECDKDNLKEDTNTYFMTMMSGITGDFSSSDKLLLGWATAYTTSGKFNVQTEISSFVTSGDVILWSDHTVTSVFDEYVTLEIYSNELLNSNARVCSKKADDTFYGLKVSKVNNSVKKTSDGKFIHSEKKYDSSAFKFDNCENKTRIGVKLNGEYEQTNTFYKDLLYLSGDGGTYCEQFVETSKLPSLTYSFLSLDDKTKKATISLTL